jgi:hypothetical protein
VEPLLSVRRMASRVPAVEFFASDGWSNSNFYESGAVIGARVCSSSALRVTAARGTARMAVAAKACVR